MTGQSLASLGDKNPPTHIHYGHLNSPMGDKTAGSESAEGGSLGDWSAGKGRRSARLLGQKELKACGPQKNLGAI
jgi:hypothetical protein